MERKLSLTAPVLLLLLLIASSCVATATGASNQNESPLASPPQAAQTNQRPSRPLASNGIRTRGLLTRNAIQGTAVEVAPPAPIELTPVVNSPKMAAAPVPAPISPPPNRATRTADIFRDGDGYNIFVTNTCERESTKVNIRTSRPFYGVIHTKNHRRHNKCSVEGEGEQEFNLDISHALNESDSNYCGVVRNQRISPEDKDTLSVVLAVRVHRTVELSDDKFFILNCTNRCRTSDCSSQRKSGSLLADDSATDSLGREREPTTTPSTGRDLSNPDECSLDKLPHILTLLWCMGIIILGLLLTLCCICSSFFCRHVKTEIVEEVPSVYEGQTDDEMDAYNKKHPNRIDYDNKDIYTTKNNYEPYRLDRHSGSSKRRRN